MKLNISYPANGSQKIIEVDDERKLRPFMEKRMGTEVGNPSSPWILKTSDFQAPFAKERGRLSMHGCFLSASWAPRTRLQLSIWFFRKKHETDQGYH